MSLIELAIKKSQDTERVPAAALRIENSISPMSEAANPPNDASTGRTPSLPSRRIVHLDRTALVDAGFLPPTHNQRQIADQMRNVKRPLLAAALGRGIEPLAEGRMIMLTSAVPNEGKTFVSFNLAVSMSLERDISVVLVDADVAKRHISHQFSIDAEPGLLEAVQDEELDIESLVLPTSIPNLSVLPAGKPTEIATEVIASHRMQSVVAKLGLGQERKRVVIFDSPPLLVTSEARVLAQHMGQIVLVVRAGTTPQQVVMDAINCLGHDRSISLLLNQSESINEAGYYYRDGAYGQYTRDGERQSTNSSQATST